jgi:hypothetical protein
MRSGCDSKKGQRKWFVVFSLMDLRILLDSIKKNKYSHIIK